MKKLTYSLLALVVLGYFPLVAHSSAVEIPKRISDVERITVSELQQLQAKEPVLIIDTRAPGQWIRAKDKIPGAVRIVSHDDVKQLKKDFAPDHAIVTYCT
ncbi:MAG: hypothetical protein JXQ81_05140 [Desulfuromonadales bacterium]|nr:hypothetical protein [Desulfuromonadales bacterium]MBN2791875.1 hypothetical protein [Desulfuromonadales bacterium]